MIQDKDLFFLCEKIEQLRTATFINFSTALLRFPVSVIELSATDDEGNLWFKVRKPYKCIEDLEQYFPAQLHFFNKDFNYRIAVHGKATITKGRNRIAFTTPFNTEADEQYTIIKFKILNAEYCFNKKSTSSHLKDTFNNMLNKILSNEDTILYRF